MLDLLEKCIEGSNERSKEEAQDGSHDIEHLKRVARLSLLIAKEEKANERVVYAAAMLHDIVCLPKNHPQAYTSSLLAAKRAEELLLNEDFPKNLIPNVVHAIHAHSFSAKIEPFTIEAKCVQDADRMEALGAFGLMRVFYTSGKLGSQLMHLEDPAGLNRALNDKMFALDHFVLKLLTLHKTMQTKTGRAIAFSRAFFLEDFRNQIIKDHCEGNHLSSRFTIANLYHEAGKKGLSLFTPLDHLSKKKDPYICLFLDQLKREL